MSDRRDRDYQHDRARSRSPPRSNDDRSVSSSFAAARPFPLSTLGSIKPIVTAIEAAMTEGAIENRTGLFATLHWLPVFFCFFTTLQI